MTEQTSKILTLTLTRTLGFGCAAFLVAPAVGASTPLAPPNPTPMTDVCGQASIDIDIDVATGEVYYIDPVTNAQVSLDDPLEVGFGSLGHVVVELHYSSSEWMVTITPDTDPAVTYQTNNGSLRYSLSDDIEEYTFTSSEVTSASTMMNMVPTIPNFKIRPRKSCDE